MIPAYSSPTPPVKYHNQQNIKEVNYKTDLEIQNIKILLTNFAEISEIYRESGHCDEISKYLSKRLNKLDFTVKVKPDGTIIASRGLNKEKNNAIILQAHMDIVAESTNKDPKTPIKFIFKDGWLYAKGRTLGADNGIGVAAALIIAEDPMFKNYPLEIIITTNEETTMKGARLLTPKDFYGKYLINLDSETLGVLTTGCAGITEYEVSEKIKTKTIKTNNYSKISISLTGAKGGHSASISEGYLNPIKVLLNLLTTKDYKVMSINGGDKFNTVPTEAQLEIIVPTTQAETTQKNINKYLSAIKNKNLIENPNLNYKISISSIKSGTKYIEPKIQKKLLKNINSIPTGLLSKYKDTGLNKTSQNLGQLTIIDEKCTIKIMERSSDKKENKEVQIKTQNILSGAFNKAIKPTTTTPIWESKSSSELEKIATNAYSKVTNNGKSISRIEHGGLESAIFADKCPNVEQISIGPTIKEPHSVREKVNVSTILPFYNWLSKILEELKNK